jgi:hypothetical protein
MERSVMRERLIEARKPIPDFAPLHQGYEGRCGERKVNINFSGMRRFAGTSAATSANMPRPNWLES